jgi:hypothetical protein
MRLAFRSFRTWGLLALVSVASVVAVERTDLIPAAVRFVQPPAPPTDVKIGAPDPVAPTYYVRTDGNNSNTGLTNSSGGAFLTIDFALDNADPGDVIRVQAGHYAQRVTPAINGTVGNTITLIADGAASFCGMTVNSKNYIRVIGFTVDMNASGCSDSIAFTMGGTNTGWEFWHNTIRDVSVGGISHSDYADRQHNFVVIGNTFINIGSGGANGTAVSTRGHHSVFAYNEMDDADPDQFNVDGTSNQWLNNYFHNVSDTNTLHSDIFFAGSSSLGLQFNLYEGNRAIGTGNLSDEHGVLFQSQGPGSCSTGSCGAMNENLFRQNVWHNHSGGHMSGNDALETPITNFRLVNETVVDVMRNASTYEYTASFYGSGVVTARLHNNINVQAWGSALISGIQVFLAQGAGSILSADYNLAYDPDGAVSFTTPWTTQANELSNVNPSFTNHASDDFTLQSGSSARNAGGPLTTTSGSGTGTTFNVASGGGGFFRGPNTNLTAYGGALTQGDVITVGTDVVTVVSVSTDAITVTPSFTWANAENVYLGSDATPDLGAFPYFASYTLTATSSASLDNIRTITPSNAALVRFVTCYSNGVPYAVDNSSPYTCANVAQFSARVYPRYAVATRYVTATPE